MRHHEEEYFERHSGVHGEPDDDSSPTEGWCAHCNKECIGVAVDNGIGAYEYWGSKGVDKRIDIESNCCNAQVLDYDPHELDEAA